MLIFASECKLEKAKGKGMRQLSERISLALSDSYEGRELATITRSICCDLLGLSSSTYYIKDNKVTLTPKQDLLLESILNRLQQGEPLQYIEGRTPFCGMEFKVSPAVLIPRPETAELIDWVASEHGNEPLRLIDLGTGSGCIAIALSRRLPRAIVDACDISTEALAVARENNSTNGTKVSFFEHDILNLSTPLPHSYNIIVSNPPYIRQSEAENMSVQVTEWEPRTALFVPDEDALRFYRAIAEIGQTDALLPGGHIYVEINQTLGKETAALFERYGYKDVEVRRDIFGNNRMVKGVKGQEL